MIWLALIATQAVAMSRGEYVLRVSGCIHCHTQNWTEPLAGQRRLDTPFGAFYPPNITPDKETGIGQWTESNFARAVREGVAPNGSLYYPAFPYRAYAGMADEDVHELYVYIMSLRPIRKARRPHEIAFPFNQRWLLNFWQGLFFSKPKANPPTGEYLVEALGHCAECHTPRNQLGAVITDQWLAGSPEPLNGWIAPNITPDPETGLGNWSARDWEIFLSSGFKPSGESAGGEMAFVLQGLAVLTPQDRAAMIAYLSALKPVHHEVRP